MTPTEIIDSARPIILIGGTGAVLALLIAVAFVVLHLRKDARKKRTTEQARSEAHARDLARHDPTIHRNRPYPRETTP